MIDTGCSAAPADVDVGPSPPGPVPAGRAAGAAGRRPPAGRAGPRPSAPPNSGRSSGRSGSSAAAQHSCGPEHVGVGRVGDRGLDRAAEDRLRVVGEVVVQRVVPGDEDDQRLLLRPARAAGLLPQRGERPRVAGQHHRVQPGDVDAELEGVGRRDAQQVTGRQRPLQLPPFLGQVAAAVGVHPADEVVAAAVVQQPPGLLGHRLRAAPRPDERQGAGAALDQVGQQRRRVGGGRAAQRCPVLAGALGQRRLPERERGAGAGGAVVGDRLDGRAHQPATRRPRARRPWPRPARTPAPRRTAGRSSGAGAARARRASRTPRGRRGTRR